MNGGVVQGVKQCKETLNRWRFEGERDRPERDEGERRVKEGC